MTIIEIQARSDGGHGLQSQSGRDSCWLEGWIEVPPQLEQQVWDSLGYCTLDIRDGKLVGITPTTRPEPEPAPAAGPTAEERLTALESAMLSMMGVNPGV